MEALKVRFSPQATRITVKLSILDPDTCQPRRLPSITDCIASKKWQNVLSALTDLSDVELGNVLPELIIQLESEKSCFISAKYYAGFVISLHILARNLGMDLRAA
jgi:hypothetical protein